jgi:hypothetical protein
VETSLAPTATTPSGYGTVQNVWTTSTYGTSAAAANNVASVPIPDNANAKIRVYASAQNTSTGDSVDFESKALVKRWSGGGAALIGTSIDTRLHNDTSLASATVTVVVSSNSAVVQVNQGTTGNHTWSVDVRAEITAVA